MPRITIEVYGSLRERLGWRKRVVEIPGETPKLKDLAAVVPKLENILKEQPIVLVNGIHIQFTGGLDTPLKDGDNIAIFPPGGGG